jgi:hypothetical protein
MILDNKLWFDSNHTIPTPVSADFASTYTLDTEVAGANQGAGTPLWVVVKMLNIQTGTTGETLAALLQDCTTSGGTFATILAGRSFSGGEFANAPTLLAAPLPAHHRRYLKVTYDCSSGLVWTGGVDAYIAINAPNVKDGVFT